MRFRSLKWLFVLQAAVLAFLVLGSSFGIIQLHYPRVIENSPLIAPVKVQSISASKLVLEDGRSFEVFYANYPDIALLIKESENLVDLHFYSGTEVEIYVKQRGFICGNSWQGLIEIPLIADIVPRYHRDLVGLAKIGDQPEHPLE
jgi:hypothetical protein